MSSMTITATQGGSTANGIQMTLKVLTNCLFTGGAVNSAGPAISTTDSEVAVTPTFSNSRIYIAAVGGAASTPTFTINGTSTTLSNTQDGTNKEVYGSAKSTSLTTASTPITVGYTAGSSTTTASAGIEIPAATSAGPLEDASSPSNVSTTSATTIATASFTPPANSLLLAMVASDGGAGTTTMTVSGGGLTWTEQKKVNGTGDDYCGVWTAPFYGFGAPARLSQAVNRAAYY
jgi:hypothetical protein